MPPRLCYLIASLPRSGSNLLAGGLRAAGIAGRPEEYFNFRYEQAFLQQWGNPAVGEYQEFIQCAHAAGTTSNGVFGAKMHWDQFARLLRQARCDSGDMDRPAAEAIAVLFPNVRYLWMVRQDKLRQAVSFLKAIQLNVWWQSDARRGVVPGVNPSTVQPEPVFDFGALRRLEAQLIAQEARWQQYFTASALRPHVVTYEALAEDYAGCVRAALDYLEIPGRENAPLPPPVLRKQADAVSEEWVHRYLTEKRAVEPLNPQLYGWWT